MKLKLVLAFCLFLVTMHLHAQQGLHSNAVKPDWWNIDRIGPYVQDSSVKPLSRITIKGKHFVDASGKPVIFEGLSIADPDKIVKDGRWGRHHFEVIKSWGVNIVRIPVIPVSVHQRGIAEYVKILDEAVKWCSELGMYVIVDWHSMGNLKMQVFAHDMMATSQQETFNFWGTISEHYNGVNTVAFYELFNEPTLNGGRYGSCTWEEWKIMNEQMIDLIRAYDSATSILVAGFNWAYDLTPVATAPINRENIGYVVHPYPGKRDVPREPQWEKDFGFVADKYPVIATEIGFMKPSDDKTLLDDGIYGSAIMNYFHKKGISWVVWVFDPEWVPQMIQNWDYERSDQGRFFRDVMLGKFKYNN